MIPTLRFDASRRPIFVLPINFDVPGHELSLETFISTSVEYEKLIAAFNQSIFDGQLQYKIYVLAPESGSFRSNIGVALIAGLGALTATILSDFGKGFVTGLTDMPPEEWGEVLGETIRNQISDKLGDEVTDEQLEQAISAQLLVESSKGFLEKTTSNLREVGIGNEEMPEAFVAKNDFYNALELNPQVSGVSFGDTPKYPIPREEFIKRVTPVKVEKDKYWEIETTKYMVTSPNWDPEDKQRGWKGRGSNGLTVYFTISDENFWKLFAEGLIKSNTIDELIVQVASCYEKERLKKRVVLNVLSYNGHMINPELSYDQLQEKLERLGFAYFDESDGLFERE